MDYNLIRKPLLDYFSNYFRKKERKKKDSFS